ncbi:unnamed protein product [Durusdinium trenchii]|uniref:Lon N-terminal domain-containing protein n=1 Tax=Durusdinium trenchii TaxID=1381693 RepID=A0ABP0JAJ6_9DINO
MVNLCHQLPMRFDILLPAALVFLQLLWSVVFPHLPWPTPGATPAPPVSPAPPGAPETVEVTVEASGHGSGLGWAPRNTVRWLEEVEVTDVPRGAHGAGEAVEEEPVEVPLFPLSGFYALGNRPKLKIFEPRYRQLYKDLLSSKMHHFAVTTVDPETGHLAAVGVLLRLEALQDVEAETEGAVKYLAEHTVLRRIEIQRLVNPEALSDSSTYLRAAVVHLEDVAVEELQDVSLSELEADTLETFKDVISAYPELKELQVNASQRGLWELSNSWINGYWGAARMNDLRQQLVSQMRSIHEGSLREGEVNQEVQELQEIFDSELWHLRREQVTGSGRHACYR